jgi:hypothetical protein
MSFQLSVRLDHQLVARSRDPIQELDQRLAPALKSPSKTPFHDHIKISNRAEQPPDLSQAPVQLLGSLLFKQRQA